MPDDDDRPYGREPTEEELRAEQEEFFRKTSDHIPIPYNRHVLAADYVFDPDDFRLRDLFDRRSPYLKDDGRLAHVFIQWFDELDRPTHLQELWTPASLWTPQDLLRVTNPTSFETAFIERGVASGIVRAKEGFYLRRVTTEQKELLKVPADYNVMVIWREFFDAADEAVCAEQLVLTRGMARGHERSFPAEGAYRYEW